MPASAALRLSCPLTHESWEVPILHQDEHVLALDKPARLLTTPNAEDVERPSLMRLLHEGIAQGKHWASAHNLTHLTATHRLDFETTGVLVLAKNPAAHAALTNAFGSHKPVQTYVTLARGMPTEPEFTIEARIGPQTRQEGLMRIDSQGGKPATTRCKVLTQFRGFTLLQCQPVTNRMHQIRVHLRSVGLHIVGDVDYAGSPLYLSQIKSSYQLKPRKVERPLVGRVALHAERLELPHPATGEPLVVAAEWPKDLRVAVRYLGEFSGL